MKIFVIYFTLKNIYQYKMFVVFFNMMMPLNCLYVNFVFWILTFSWSWNQDLILLRLSSMFSIWFSKLLIQWYELTFLQPLPLYIGVMKLFSPLKSETIKMPVCVICDTVFGFYPSRNFHINEWNKFYIQTTCLNRYFRPIW